MEPQEILFEEGEEFSKQREKEYAQSTWKKILNFLKRAVTFITERVSMLLGRIAFGRRTGSRTPDIPYRAEAGKEETGLKEDREEEQEADLEEDLDIDQKTRDVEACKLLAVEQVREEFLKLGITAFPEQEKDCILLAMKDEKYQNVLFGSMQKTDLIYGRADRLAATLYEKRLQDSKEAKDIQKLKLEAAIDAAVCMANIRIRSYGPEEAARLDRLANVCIELPQGAAEIEIKNDQDHPEQMQVLFNGDHICDCEPESMRLDEIRDTLRDNILCEYEQAEEKHHHIGEQTKKGFRGFEFFQRKDGKTAVMYKNEREKRKLGIYSFKSTRDIEELSKKIQGALGKTYTETGQICESHFNIWINKEGFPVEGKTLAYTIAAVSSPSMEQDIQDGKYYNPLTSEYEPGGAAHIQISHDARGVTFSQCVPESGHSGYQMKTDEIKGYRSLSELSTKDLNELAVALQRASDENRSIEDIVPDHIRIPDVIHISPILPDDKAEAILKQNALDERTHHFTDLSAPEKDVNVRDVERTAERDSLENDAILQDMINAGMEPDTSYLFPGSQGPSQDGKIDVEIDMGPVFDVPVFEVPGGEEENSVILPDNEPER